MQGYFTISDRRIVRLQSDSSRERTLEKTEKERGKRRAGEEERGEQWGETKTFKVFQRITRKSYHRKRISLRFYSRRREAPESRERTFEAIGKLFVLIGHSYCLNFAPATREERDASPPKRGGRLSSRKITSLCVVRVDVYGEWYNARAHTGRSRGATTSSSSCTYLRHENCHGRSQTFLLK